MATARLSVLVLACIVVTGASAARADDGASAALLAEIDSLLAEAGARRVTSSAPTVCVAALDGAGPGAVNRDFLCDRASSTPVGQWQLQRLRAHGGQRVTAELELRRFTSAAAAQEIKREAMARYGGREVVSIHDGAISWCYLEVFWTDELLIALQYGCHISLRHVPALHRVHDLLRARAAPFGAARAVAVNGSHSGWSWLLNDQGERIVAVSDAERFTRYVQVIDVGDRDVLWIRERPEGRALELDRLGPDARCVPVVMAPTRGAWLRVKGPAHEGWAGRRYLREQPAGECMPAPSP